MIRLLLTIDALTLCDLGTCDEEYRGTSKIKTFTNKSSLWHIQNADMYQQVIVAASSHMARGNSNYKFVIKNKTSTEAPLD
jgi:hypothetical protein